MTVADFTIRLVIINRTGTTHRFIGDEPKCEALATAPRREFVSTNQCLVYGLACCGTCFPVADEYARLIHRPGRMTGGRQ